MMINQPHFYAFSSASMLLPGYSSVLVLPKIKIITFSVPMLCLFRTESCVVRNFDTYYAIASEDSFTDSQ